MSLRSLVSLRIIPTLPKFPKLLNLLNLSNFLLLLLFLLALNSLNSLHSLPSLISLLSPFSFLLSPLFLVLFFSRKTLSELPVGGVCTESACYAEILLPKMFDYSEIVHTFVL